MFMHCWMNYPNVAASHFGEKAVIRFTLDLIESIFC